MFTGIVTHLGLVEQVVDSVSSRRFYIQTPLSQHLTLGCSIACDGCCLTVTEKTATRFCVSVSQETLQCTSLGLWQPGHAVNLEQALRADQRLDGHIVTGHIDGIGKVVDMADNGPMNLNLTISYPEELAPFLAAKGSVALNGVSLTVNSCSNTQFSVNIIDYTKQHTNLGQFVPQQSVNLEIDILSRYVGRHLAFLS